MMKRSYIAAACLTLSMALLLAACGSGGSDASSPAGSQSGGNSSVADSSAPDASAPDSSAPQTQALFTPGTWLSDAGQYYFFDADGASGRTASLENGTGVAFSYTVEGERADFAMGAADNSSACSVSGEGNTLTLTWEDGTTEHLTYVSEEGSDSFQFYTNQELADLALSYYKEHSEDQDTDGLTAAAQTNEDGSVTIQVYENLGDHNSTAEWYTVDRATAAGTDSAGGEVSLAQ